MKNQDFLFKAVEGKTVTWCSNENQYVVLENITADIIKRLYKEIPIKDIAKALSKKIDAPEEKTIDFILDIKRRFLKSKTKKDRSIINDYRDVKNPESFEYVKYYQVNNIVFKVSFLSENELYLIHPKFSHLEIKKATNYHHTFDVFTKHNYTFLTVNNQIIGSWSRNDIHYFQGKFSMELIQKIHHKEESDWMGVFHASALSNDKKAILFLGDSGNGKSTSLALLQANGFTCLADDFVPIDEKKQEVYSFPAAISIKKNSLETLLPIYPELETTAEYHFERLNKIVRFLKPNNTDFTKHLPCKDLIFIKYEKSAELKFTEISKLEAFQQLVPDSWLSPNKENAAIFLDWFSKLNCYSLTYSRNEEMIDVVTKIFNDEL